MFGRQTNPFDGYRNHRFFDGGWKKSLSSGLKSPIPPSALTHRWAHACVCVCVCVWAGEQTNKQIPIYSDCHHSCILWRFVCLCAMCCVCMYIVRRDTASVLFASTVYEFAAVHTNASDGEAGFFQSHSHSVVSYLLSFCTRFHRGSWISAVWNWSSKRQKDFYNYTPIVDWTIGSANQFNCPVFLLEQRI